MVSDHRGNIVKRMGDGWIVEFNSVSKAVRCALDLQSQVSAQSSLKLRVGVHLGDVVFDEEDIFGDGINIAARLQEASNEEAVLISNVVYRSLGERLAEQFHRAGARQFKNASSPVEVFQWSPPGFAPPRLTPAIHSKSLLIGVLPFDRLFLTPIRNFLPMALPKRSSPLCQNCRTYWSSRAILLSSTKGARWT